MTDQDNPTDIIEVTKCPEEQQTAEDKRKFKMIKQIRTDLKVLYKKPQTIWDENFIGEAIADECHPPNSSFAIGATGGFVTGLATGFFSTSRVPMPVRTPIPSPLLPTLRSFLRSSVIASSVLWKISKRTLLGTVLFAVLECDFKDLVKNDVEKWRGSIAAGAVCGGIFGLRGGLPGMLVGVALFTSIPMGREIYQRKEDFKFKLF